MAVSRMKLLSNKKKQHYGAALGQREEIGEDG
jgi:hypothetical protein